MLWKWHLGGFLENKSSAGISVQLDHGKALEQLIHIAGCKQSWCTEKGFSRWAGGGFTRLSKIMSQRQLYSLHDFSTTYCLLYWLCGAVGIPASSVLALLACTNVFHLLRGHPGAGNKQLPRELRTQFCSLDCPCSILVPKCDGSLIILMALNKLRMEKPIKCCIPLNLIEALSNTLVVLGFHPNYLNI